LQFSINSIYLFYHKAFFNRTIIVMWSTKRITWILLQCIKIFFIGLLLHFFLHTFITFSIWREGVFRKIIWARKEIFILWGLFLLIIKWYNLYKENKLEHFIKIFPLKKYVIIIIITSIIIIIMGTIIHNVWLATTLLSRRYSMLWFLIFVIGSLLAMQWYNQINIEREKWYIKITKYLLIGWIIWWSLIYFLPAFIELFGYNKYIYEWQVWQQPPAVYYSNITQWIVRNQFLFERPIHWGMFLIALWPLFFLIAIRNKSTGTQLWRSLLYWLNIISTLSRAAWIAWIIQTIIIILILHQKDIKKMVVYGFLPIFATLIIITYWAKDDILYRNFSNLWHIKHTMTAIQKVTQRPIIGRWPWFAWPASHHRKDIVNYNPENQYLQIWLEYWAIWFLWRIYLYIQLQILWYRSYQKMIKEKLTKQQRYHSRIIIALSLWLFWLTIEWFFLHSFVDRMIVYPLMLLFGICFWIYYKNVYHEYSIEKNNK